MFGLTAGFVVPGTMARAMIPVLSNKEDGKPVAFRIRPQPRAVARGDGAA